jgi:hypothetical protein
MLRAQIGPAPAMGKSPARVRQTAPPLSRVIRPPPTLSIVRAWADRAGGGLERGGRRPRYRYSDELRRGSRTSRPTVVFKTPTKLHQIFINIGGAIAIGILHHVLCIRNASPPREIETSRKSTLRIRRHQFSIQCLHGVLVLGLN